MITSRATRSGRLGSMRKASARLVSGASATSVSSPGRSRVSRNKASAAGSSVSAARGAGNPTSPKPS
jgi:hypothetical protein